MKNIRREIRLQLNLIDCTPMKSVLTDFTQHTSIHGVQYLGQNRCNWLGRFFWIFAILISLFGCLTLIHETYSKWTLSPVVVTFNGKSTPVEEIPFPSITICPRSKTNRDIFNFTSTSKKVYDYINPNLKRPGITENEKKQFEALSQICNNKRNDFHHFLKSSLKENEILSLIRSLSIKIGDTIYGSAWKFKNCDSCFSEIITEEGVCFTFNILDSKDLFRTENIAEDLFNFDNNQESSWNLQDGYKSLTDSYSGNKSIYPRRVEGAGIFYGLFIGLKSKISNYDYVCKGPAQKFLVAFHLPSEIPRLTKQYFSVPLQNHVTVQIKPMMMTTDKELKNYDPILRQCFFNDERYLKFFKTYTQNNCEIECLSNYTLGRCGCVAFWMPRDKLTKVCDYRKKSCAGFESESELYGDKYKLKKILKSNVFKGKFEPCNCLPSCTSISYDTEISQAPYSSEAERIFYENVKLSFAKTLEGYESSRLLIMFKESQFITKKRSEVYGLTSFMANCGGLLGLFMGASLLSLIEFFYFFCCRVICSLKDSNKDIKKNSDIERPPTPEISNSMTNDSLYQTTVTFSIETTV